MLGTRTLFDHNEDSSNVHLAILQDVSQVINFSDNFQTTLDQVVSIVANRLKMDVCSIYLFNPEKNTLILQATKGLNLKSLGNVKLKLGEGVVSLAIEEMKAISIDSVQKHPRFLNFPEADEGDFNSFLGVPIIDSKNPIGVLVVQKKKNYQFNINEINMLQILAVQVSSVIQVATVLEKTIQSDTVNHDSKTNPSDSQVQKPKNSAQKKVLTLQGLPTSFGYGYGKVILLDERYNFSVITDQKVEDIQLEMTRLHDAVSKSKEEILNIKKSLQAQISADILGMFDSHILMLDDKQLLNKIHDQITKGNNASFATLQVINEYIDTFSKFDDPYIKEKIVDFEDIGRRIITNLLGLSQIDLHNLPGPCVVVSKFLTPSTTANLDTSKVVGIVTEHGGSTSHASILARSLEIPAVVGVQDILSKISVEDHLIVDGNTGFVLLNPQKVLIHEYEKKAELEIQNYHNYFLQYTKHPLATKDRIPINIGANIGMTHDVDVAIKNGANSVGLFRTEFLYMTRNRLPTVSEQYEIYKEVAQSFPDGEIIFRTLDLGGDKVLSYLPFPHEDNPVLGYKSTRFLLDHPKILFDQLRAILQASVHGNIKILFPMISSLSELIQLKDFLEIAKGTLTYNQLEFNDKIEVGMMIEVPSVIFQLEDFIPEADFFSIGTNDLVQYLLAVDRDNEKVSNIYNPLHPAILRAINSIATRFIHSQKRLAVCGEMAGTPQTSLALLALGVRDLSSSPSSIPYLHYLIQQLNQGILDEVKANILSFSDVLQVENYLRKTLRDIAPQLYAIFGAEDK